MPRRPCSRSARLLACLLAAAACTGAPWQGRAADVLFYGNSYTMGLHEPSVEDHGGVPHLVEVIARGKGRALSTRLIGLPGRSLAYHLEQKNALAPLHDRRWDCVVLQDYSTEPTHIGDVAGFLKAGTTFYQSIREFAPDARIVLYETWARPAGSPLYGGESTAKTFANPAEMTAELSTNYHKLADALEEREPGRQVAVAPVGEAFAACLAQHPGITLHTQDLHHANREGIYLAALVLYATIFQDSPLGAPIQWDGGAVDPAVAAKLQAIAEAVTKSARG